MPATKMTARITSKGQVTIPKAVRERLGLKEGDEIEFVAEDGRMMVRKRVAEGPFTKWRGYLKHLAGRDTDEIIREMRGE